MGSLNEPEGATATVRTERRGTEAIVALTGEIDISNAEQVRAAVAEVVLAQPKRVVFDLSHLDYLDSSGIAVLLGAAERSSVEVRHASPVIERLLRATGVAGVLHLPE
jgi:anti-sigma B factor antagonist